MVTQMVTPWKPFSPYLEVNENSLKYRDKGTLFLMSI